MQAELAQSGALFWTHARRCYSCHMLFKPKELDLACAMRINVIKIIIATIPFPSELDISLYKVTWLGEGWGERVNMKQSSSKS